MGIRLTCPNGHQLHVKAFLAGKRGVCPKCGAKIQIPAEKPQTAERQIASQANVTESSLAPPAERSNFGSQSVVIAVTDSVETTVREPVHATAPADLAPSLPQNGSVQPQDIMLTPASAQPFVDADSIEPVSPAVRYVAQRERNRRNQFTLAVFLLIAVLVLAAVLIWVLRQNAQPSADKTAPSAVSQFTTACVQLAIS